MKAAEFAHLNNEDSLIASVQIRDIRVLEPYRLGKGSQLRSKKHAFQAVAWDILGNATVLDRRGNVRQLIKGDAEFSTLPR